MYSVSKSFSSRVMSSSISRPLLTSKSTRRPACCSRFCCSQRTGYKSLSCLFLSSLHINHSSILKDVGGVDMCSFLQKQTTKSSCPLTFLLPSYPKGYPEVNMALSLPFSGHRVWKFAVRPTDDTKINVVRPYSASNSPYYAVLRYASTA
jgi:hypothetical protein